MFAAHSNLKASKILKSDGEADCQDGEHEVILIVFLYN